MNHKKIIIIATAIFFLTPLFSVSAVTTGMRNPAAAYCIDLGYEHEIKKSPEGEYGVCKFPDGSEVEEWKFFAGQEKREYNFCTRSGYGTKTVSDERCVSASKCALCVLDDGTEEEAASLMKLKVVVIDQEKDIQNKIEEAPNKKDYFKDIDGYLVGAIIGGLILIVAFVYKKKKNKQKNI